MKETNFNKFELFEGYPDVMDFHQAREALGVDRTGIYKLIEQGLLKCFNIDNTYKISKTALLAYVHIICKGGEYNDWKPADQE